MSGEQSGLIAKDYHMASPCSTHPARLPVCWKGVCGLAGIQLSSLDLPAHPMERNETDLSAHSIPGKSGQELGGRLINHNSLASTSPFPITPETEDYLGEPPVASVQFRLGFCIRLSLTTNTWNSVLLFEPVTVRG